MTATLATLPTDTILSISAFLSNPSDLLSLSRACRSAFLASQAWASYWSKLVPVAHLSRPAPWQSYSPSELRDAHIRYAASHRQWESPLPTFKPPLRLPAPQGLNGHMDYFERWVPIQGTRWAWSWELEGRVSFCDLRAGLVIGNWNTGGPVISAFIESRSPNECVLCHWMHPADNITEFEIVATSVTFKQENPISPIKCSFKTIQRVQIEKGISLSNNAFTSPMVLWRDCLIGSYTREQSRTHGLFIWSMTENSIFYFEMEFVHCTKVLDDLLFTSLNISDGTNWNTAYRCIHIPSLVTSTQLPGGSLSLTEDAFAVLLPKCIMKSRTTSSLYYRHFRLNIYSIPVCAPTHPRYCFIIKRFLEKPRGVEWEVLEVEIDLSIPGPIKIFSRVSQQYTDLRPTFMLHDIDDDLLLYLPLGCEDLPRASLSIRFLQVGKPGKERPARLEGVDQMHLTGLSVDRDAGYVIVWVPDHWPGWTPHYCSFIWWLEERNPGNMVYSRTNELISSWIRELLRHF